MYSTTTAKRCCAIASALLLAGFSARLPAQEETGAVPALMQEAEKQFQAFRCDKAEAGAARAAALLREAEPRRALSADEEASWLRANEIIAGCKLEAGQLDAVKSALKENLA